MKLIESESLFEDGQIYWDRLLADIAQAEKEIIFETYIFEDGNAAHALISEMARAHQRGVAIRLLVDGAGTPFFGGDLARKLQEAGVEVRIFRPVPWHFWHWFRRWKRRQRFPSSWGRLSQSFVRFFWDLWTVFNHRNHRKVCVIDHRIAWIGSFNVTDQNFPPSRGGSGWKDLSVRIEGPHVHHLERIFESAWSRRYQLFLDQKTDMEPIRSNHTRARRRRLYRELITRIRQARHRIWVMTAYYVPPVRLAWALARAAERGVDVRFVLPRHSDVVFIPWVSALWYPRLLKSGAKIWEYEKAMMHSKALLIDDWMMVGSTNLNHRSFFRDLEVDYVLSQIENQKFLERLFLEEAKQSRLVTMADWGRRPFYQRWLGALFSLLKSSL